MAFRIAEMSVTPSPLRPGVFAHARCRVEADVEVRRVYAMLPDGSTVEFQRINPTEFELTQQVPWDTPTGTYPVTIIAEAASGERTFATATINIA